MRSVHPACIQPSLLVFLLLALFVSCGSSPPSPPPPRATLYYIDCSVQSNGGGTQDSPWNSLASANAFAFRAGDTLLLGIRAGTGPVIVVGNAGYRGTNANFFKNNILYSAVPDMIYATSGLSIDNNIYWTISGHAPVADGRQRLRGIECVPGGRRPGCSQFLRRSRDAESHRSQCGQTNDRVYATVRLAGDRCGSKRVQCCFRLLDGGRLPATCKVEAFTCL